MVWHYGKLIWRDEEGVGLARLSDDFQKETPIFRLDALKDWIFDLQEMYNVLLAEMNDAPPQPGTDNEAPKPLD